MMTQYYNTKIAYKTKKQFNFYLYHTLFTELVFILPILQCYFLNLFFS